MKHSISWGYAFAGLLAWGMLTPAPVVASVIANGNYFMTIAETPMSGGNPDFSMNGSGLFIGCLPGNGCGKPMLDEMPATTIGGNGSGIGGDGVAGLIGLSVTGGFIAVTSFNIDAILGTAAGDFVQFGDLSSATGFADTAGNMTLTLTGRQGAATLLPGGFRWNVDDFTSPSTAWTPFTSGSACNSLGCVTGSAVINIGDVNGDFIDDYKVTLVSAGVIGNDLGALAGAEYFEVWNSQTTILSAPTAVPLPGAAWLLLSGLGTLWISGAKGRQKSV